jgi:hypothetical protein
MFGFFSMAQAGAERIKAFMERRKPEGCEAAQVLLDEGCFTDPVVVRALRACADLEGEG